MCNRRPERLLGSSVYQRNGSKRIPREAIEEEKINRSISLNNPVLQIGNLDRGREMIFGPEDQRLLETLGVRMATGRHLVEQTQRRDLEYLRQFLAAHSKHQKIGPSCIQNFRFYT